MRASTWNGRRGAVLLGPTEHRVAQHLAGRTRSGWISVRTVELAATLHLERSEAYRITARLRDLGLFGIANDRSGQRGGRRVWRTLRLTQPGALNAERHRQAWARIRAWVSARLTRQARAVRAAHVAPGPIAERMTRARALDTSSAPRSFAEHVLPGLNDSLRRRCTRRSVRDDRS